MNAKHISHYHKSAGGVLYNRHSKKIALIHFPPSSNHTELWALPKGHLDRGETPRQAAKREIMEETGYVDIKPIRKIGQMQFTYSHYIRKNEKNHKIIYCYLFELVSESINTSLRESYERHDVVWKNFREALTLVKYENARRMIEKAQTMVERTKNRERPRRHSGLPPL